MNRSDLPLVSLITPTMNRERFLALQYDALGNQTYPNIEWLVHDGSEHASVSLADIDADHVQYFHDPAPLSIGLKRNFLLNKARGEIIVHLDDDDFYAPDYVERMVRELDQGFDLVKLSSFFLYSTVYQKMGYWDLGSKEEYCQIWSANPLSLARKDMSNTEIHNKVFWGYGFSYAYRREVGEAIPFPDQNWAEDTEFILQAIEQFRCNAFKDQQGLVLHVLHESNTSNSYPQDSMPAFALEKFFPDIPRGFLE